MKPILCFHTRTLGYGIHKKRERFYIETIPYEVTGTIREKINGKITHREIHEVGYMCPKDFRIYRII